MGAGLSAAWIARGLLAPLSSAQRLAVAAELVAGVDDPECALALRQIAELAARRADDLFDRQFAAFHQGEGSRVFPHPQGDGPR